MISCKMFTMHICHFTSTFLPRVGGVEMVVSHLAQCQHDSGNRVTVITPRIRGVNNYVNVPYRVVHYIRPSSKRFLTRQVLIRLLWEHWKHPFDVLHCHSAYPHGYVSATFKRLTGVPIIITPHGPTDIMRNERIRQDHRLEQRLAFGLRSADGITAISRDIYNEILSVGGLEQDRVCTIPNGISWQEYMACPPCQAPTPYVLAMGRLVHQKGFDSLLFAFTQVVKLFPELQLYIAGAGVERNNLEELACQLGITESVRFLGLVQGQEKIAYLRGADFFVCPSRFEPFGIVVLEAMAAGLPIIATAVGGILDMIHDGQNGYLVPPNDTIALAETMVRLYASNQIKECFREEVVRIVPQYGWDRISTQYMALYRKVLKPPHVRTPLA